MSRTRVRFPIAALAALSVFAACGDDGPGNSVPMVAITAPQNGATFAFGESVTFQGTATDQEDGALTGSRLSWRSDLDGSLGNGASVTVETLSVGTHTVTLTATDAQQAAGSASIEVTVDPNSAPTAAITQPADGASFQQGATVTFQGTATDPEDGTLTGASLVWTSSLDGQIGTGTSFTRDDLSAGDHTITLTAADAVGLEGTDQVQITVVGQSPQITSISPATLTAGQAATISGSNFSSTPSANTVTIGGAAVSVTSATTTSLEISIPAGLCVPVGSAAVVVTAGGETSPPVAHPFQPSNMLSLAVGEHLLIRSPSDFCLQFDASSSSRAFLFGAQSASESAGSLTPVRFSADAAPSAEPGGEPPVALAEPPARRGTDLRTLVSDRSERMLRHREAEARLRSWERRNLAGASLAGPTDGDLVQRLDIPANVAVGDTLDVRVVNVRTSGSLCTDFTTVEAVVRLVGGRSVWLEDVGNPSNGFDNTDFQNLSDQFDQSIYQIDSTWFGAPTDVDGNDKMVVLITKEVNRAGGLLGFVFSHDLVTRQSCAASNESEIYYGKAPDPTGIYEPVGETYTLSEARADAPFILAHEFAHSIQFGRRLAQSPFPGFQASWMAEGQATLAEELNGFAREGRSAGQDYGFEAAFDPNNLRDVDWYVNAFIDMAIYFGFGGRDSNDDPIKVTRAPHECTWLAQEIPDVGLTWPCIGNRHVYGVPWSLLRWITDQFGPTYPGGGPALHRDLVGNDISGYRNVEDVVGEDMETLLGQWAPMLYTDGRPIAGLDGRLTFPSWNLFDIFGALVDEAQLEPRERGFTDFTLDLEVRGGSSSYVRMSGTAGSGTAVRITGQGGGNLPGQMQVWIVRLQ